MLFLYVSVLVGLLVGAIAGRIAASRQRPWRSTFIIATIAATAILLIISFGVLSNHDVPSR